jgi:selenocysteine-specific elongation factor
VAANLAGVTTADIQRGNVITSPGWLKPTSRIDGKLRMLDNCKHPLRHGSMVTFFTGTEEVMARVHLLEGEDVLPGQSAWVQFTLAHTVAAVKGDHYIIRSPNGHFGRRNYYQCRCARRHRRFRSDVLQTLEAIGTGSREDTIYAILESRQPLTKEQLSVLSNVSADELEQALKRLIENKRITSIADGSGRFLFTSPGWVKLTRQAVNKLKEYHAKFPARSGMPKGELTRKLNISSGSPILQRMFTDGLLIDTGAEVRLPEYEIKLSREQREKIDIYLHQLQKNPYAPPDASSIEPDLLKMLIDQGQVIRVTGGIIFSKAAYDDMVGKVLDYARQNGSISLAQVRDMFSNSRKYAQALLDHMMIKNLHDG